MLSSSALLLLLAALGNGAIVHRRDDEPSDMVKRALAEAGVDINLKAAKPKNVSIISTRQIYQLGSSGLEEHVLEQIVF